MSDRLAVHSGGLMVGGGGGALWASARVPSLLWGPASIFIMTLSHVIKRLVHKVRFPLRFHFDVSNLNKNNKLLKFIFNAEN